MIEKGIEVRLLKPFPIIRETLGRIGIANRVEKKVFPSCYAYEKDGEYFICHFKELLQEPRLNETDFKRRDTIIWLLTKWDLVEVIDEGVDEEVRKNILEKKLFVLSRKQLSDGWEIVHKLHQYGISPYSSINE